MDVGTQARIYVSTDGRTFETGFIRSNLSKSRPKNTGRNAIKQNRVCVDSWWNVQH